MYTHLRPQEPRRPGAGRTEQRAVPIPHPGSWPLHTPGQWWDELRGHGEQGRCFALSLVSLDLLRAQGTRGLFTGDPLAAPGPHYLLFVDTGAGVTAAPVCVMSPVLQVLFSLLCRYNNLMRLELTVTHFTDGETETQEAT